MTDDNKNWLERLGSELTRGMWDSDSKFEKAANDFRDSKGNPLSEDDRKAMVEYMKNPELFKVKYRNNIANIRVAEEMNAQREQLIENSKQAFKEFALGSGMRPNIFGGGWYDPDTRTHYDDLGNEK